jgi:mRNA interferase MazF
MRTFSRGDVVRVPFPYTDRETLQYRPALVVSKGGIGEGGSLFWVIMITSAAHRGWPGDVPLGELHTKVGLPIPSVVRTSKIATIEGIRARKLGRIPPPLWREVAAALRKHLGF